MRAFTTMYARKHICTCVCVHATIQHLLTQVPYTNSVRAHVQTSFFKYSIHTSLNIHNMQYVCVCTL